MSTVSGSLQVGYVTPVPVSGTLIKLPDGTLTGSVIYNGPINANKMNQTIEFSGGGIVGNTFFANAHLTGTYFTGFGDASGNWTYPAELQTEIDSFGTLNGNISADGSFSAFLRAGINTAQGFVDQTVTLVGSDLTPPEPKLFTPNADTVNFNALTVDQKSALSNGADIHKAQGGNDAVSLPDQENAAAVGWTPGAGFFGQGGNDTITGGNGNDRINGDGGNDHLIAVSNLSTFSGNDTLSGGEGSDQYYVDNGDTIIDFKSDDAINFLARYKVDGLLVAFDGQEFQVNIFNDAWNAKDEIVIKEGVSASLLNASISGDSIALFYSTATTPVDDKLNLFTFDPTAARLRNKELGAVVFDLNKSVLKDASEELLDSALEIQFERGLQKAVPAILFSIGETLNVAAKVKDFNDEVVPVLKKAFAGDYASRSEFLKDYSLALFKVFEPGGGTAIDSIKFGKAAYAYITDQIKSAAEVYIKALASALLRFGNGNETDRGTNGPDYFYMKGGNDKAYGGGDNDAFKAGSGAGNDLYDGGSGNDIVSYESAARTVTVNLAKGFAEGRDINRDKLVSIENANGGKAGDTIIGNSKANWLDGSKGRDTLSGAAGNDTLNGGAANDLLTGGSGRNIFVFDTKLGTSKSDRKVNFDKITDFSVKDDSFYLDTTISTKFGSSPSAIPSLLDKSHFALNKAKDANDYIIFNKTTGVLFYDADGSGTKAAVEFAQLKQGLAMTHKDFFTI